MIHYISSFPGREIEIKGEPHLYFGGTSYLGLQTDLAFQDLFIKNVKAYGTNYGASRNSNVRIRVFDEIERYLAKLVGSEASTTMSSGYLAGQLVAQHFGQAQYKSFLAPSTHSAVSTAKIKPHTTYTALNGAVRAHLSSKSKSTPVVFLDSIDFSGNNYPDFDGLKSLPLEHLILVVDDSHGIGVVGKDGGGVFQMVNRLNPKELLVCCSLGKAFAVQAGAVFGNRQRIESLTGSEFFGGASPAAPAALATLMQGKQLYAEKREILGRNIQFFLSQIHVLKKFQWMPSHPVFSYGNPWLTGHLEKNRMVLTTFAYPNEGASSMSRIVLTAEHLKEDIQKLTSAINSLSEQ